MSFSNVSTSRQPVQKGRWDSGICGIVGESSGFLLAIQVLTPTPETGEATLFASSGGAGLSRNHFCTTLLQWFKNRWNKPHDDL